ncbi:MULTISPECIES: IclR family transcriptional regulator [Gordonia]|uniref:IclR family transcriptional regulator n=1 Tax=Gordonia TaxID=2053 RepID=UPI001364BE25|nr:MULTISPECIES: IclR family transcriptional regulator [Gordonia]
MARFPHGDSFTLADPPDGPRRASGMTSAELALRTVKLVGQRGSITVAELSRELGVAPSTAHRVLNNCRRTEFVRQDVSGGPYVIGPAIHELALTATSARDLRQSAEPVLEQLRNSVDEMVSFYVLEGKSVRVVQALPGGRTTTAASGLGALLPAHCTAGGKAILAHESERELRHRFPGKRLTRHTDRSITDWDALLNELDVVRRRGWAVSVGEYDPSLTSLASAVLIGSGAPAGAVVLTGFATWLRTRSEIDAHVAQVMQAANDISVRLRDNRS